MENHTWIKTDNFHYMACTANHPPHLDVARIEPRSAEQHPWGMDAEVGVVWVAGEPASVELRTRLKCTKP